MLNAIEEPDVIETSESTLSERSHDEVVPPKPRSTGRWELLNKTKAAKLLEQSDAAEGWSNRTLSDAHVDELAQLMLSGAWKNDAANTIKIAPDKRVLNGQHTLWAVIQSDLAMWLYVVRDADPDAFMSMDTGQRARKWADNRHVPARVQNLLRTHWLHDKGRLNDLLQPYRPNPVELEALFEMHPNVQQYLADAKPLRDLMADTTAAFFMEAFGRKDKVSADSFFKSLSTQTGMEEGMPVYALYQTLLKDRRKTAKLPLDVRFALTIKAWNLHRQGLPCKKLTWKSKEKFPAIA